MSKTCEPRYMVTGACGPMAASRADGGSLVFGVRRGTVATTFANRPAALRAIKYTIKRYESETGLNSKWMRMRPVRLVAQEPRAVPIRRVRRRVGSPAEDQQSWSISMTYAPPEDYCLTCDCSPCQCGTPYDVWEPEETEL